MPGHIRLLVLVAGAALNFTSCQSGPGQVLGNDEGSSPVNDGEVVEYKKAVARCHKTGGTRIVKIKGELRCF